MSVASEITRLQNAKASLKTSINAKTDQQHQITNETLEDYADFVDSIQTGGGSSYPPDWSQIGYSNTPQGILDIYNHAKEIYDNWENVSDLSSKFANDSNLVIMPFVDTSNATSMLYTFRNCNYLISIPQLNTSNVTNMNATFNSCYRLRDLPVLNTSKITTMNSPFNGCSNLSNQSLDNILQMCINATSYTGTKTLASLKLNSSLYPSATIQALPSYQNFINAGWTIGY